MAEFIKSVHDQFRLNVGLTAAGELYIQGLSLIGTMDISIRLSCPFFKISQPDGICQNMRPDIDFFF